MFRKSQKVLAHNLTPRGSKQAVNIIRALCVPPPSAYDTVNWVIFHLAVCVFTSISVFAVNVQYWQDKHPYMLLCIRLM